MPCVETQHHLWQLSVMMCRKSRNSGTFIFKDMMCRKTDGQRDTQTVREKELRTLLCKDMMCRKKGQRDTQPVREKILRTLLCKDMRCRKKMDSSRLKLVNLT